MAASMFGPFCLMIDLGDEYDTENRYILNSGEFINSKENWIPRKKNLTSEKFYNSKNLKKLESVETSENFENSEKKLEPLENFKNLGKKMF